MKENQIEEGWISVEERLPEESDYPEYQVTFSYKGYADVRHYPFGGGHWWWNGEIMDPYVTAWRPLPKSYQSKKRK